ncbi:type I-E CRISPR-associated protein Cas6/Cse3/CasE [Nitrosomonas sp. Is35]|uniref:type I-E CRISPR-associated protein Cas6/Cse3/CasE n=1 Tax=Nitrosomonas sp. Is35 TaxID=3080534 RepID=UPI00294B003A|nr:type I-E CRISPR-associated protein Cas6/Cse3/CasE [Nitrosomonas sp. Is35]MDV6346096.1 type I-E CRISPR-associated protein Cas6/Cse3/CasE [Nitrosomonas sp. Is35]
MYFSLITPSPGAERDAAMQWAKGPYGDHQWLWQFLKAEPGTERDFLFRRRDGEDHMPGFYVVSARKPQSFFDAWQVQSRDYNPQLQEGQYLSFELRANPVLVHKVNGISRRADVVMHEKKRLLGERGLNRWSDWKNTDEAKPALYELVQERCLDWLEQRAEQAGFHLLTRELHDRERGAHTEKSVRIDGYTQHRGGCKNIRFSTVDFAGELEITNALAFRKTLLSGIGHAKAFGCGLLLVRRL